MKVFLSWSGLRSRAIAEALREWIPNVIQAVEPWMSAEDVDKGLRWSSEIAVQLEDTRFGIICLTPENLESVWILFEAGALSKTIDKAFVCPLLFALDPSDVRGPLTQFQATKAEKDDMKRLILTINRALGDGSLAPEKVEKAFEHWWSDLEQALRLVPEADGKPKPERSDRELLEEILEIVRAEMREFRADSQKEDDLYSTYSLALKGGARLPDESNRSAQAALLLKRLRSRRSQPVRKRPLSYVRLHRPEGVRVTTAVREQSDGRYTVTFAEGEENGVTEAASDFQGLDLAELFADETVEESYPHDCVTEGCDDWSPAPVPAGGFGRTETSRQD